MSDMKHKLQANRSFLVNMHIHTTASDGSFSPSEAVLSAKGQHIDLMAIADHDTAEGVKQALSVAEHENICLIPALELSAEGNHEIHILGYGIDPYCNELEIALARLRNHRKDRSGKIILNLQNMGISITEEDIRKQEFDGASEGRPHIAAALVEKGYASSQGDAFARFLLKGCPAYVPKFKLPIKECISLIHQAGGKSVLAHPKDIGLPEWLLEPLIKEMKSYGLWGIEVYHPSHTGCEQYYLDLAKRLELFVTAGSDHHTKAPLLGYSTELSPLLHDCIRILAGI